MKLAFEGKLNVLLSDLLQSLGIISRAELLNKGRRDVVIYHQGLTIVLEGSYSSEDAERDARRRIEQLSCDVALAIQYALAFPQDLNDYQLKQRLKQTAFGVRVIVPQDISGTLFRFLEQKKVIAKPLEDWYELDLNGLASLIKEIGQFIITEESIRQTEEEIDNLIRDFVEYLSTDPQSQTIAENLYNSLYRLYGFSIGKPSEIKEAIFAQAILSILLSSIYYESIRYAHNLDPLKALALKANSQQALVEATYKILEINYEPIFKTTRDLLKGLPLITKLFDRLIDLASRIASKRTLLRRDLAGKVYHKIVGDWSLRKGLATFYTELPAAYLLLHLAKPIFPCRIADFACGSGTLLVAAYSAANSQYRLHLLAQGLDTDPSEIEKEFHTEFIKSCYAFDVLEYATQITALNLALHSPETPIKGLSSVHHLPLGYREEDQSVSLGSLELARSKEKLDQIFGKVTKIGVTEKKEVLLTKLLEIEPFDLIVMNPPFARATGRWLGKGSGLFGFIAEEAKRTQVLDDYDELRSEIRKVLDLEANALLKQSDLHFVLEDKAFTPYSAIGQAGEGLLFLYLADRKIKEKGKICFVLPKNLLSGTSWFLARTLLASRYHIEYIIVSYDSANGYNFSESTNLSECLVIARRLDKHADNEQTKFVILLSKPRTSIEATALASEIDRTQEDYVKAGNARAFIVRVSRQEILRYLDNWGRFIFLPNLELLEEIKSLLGGIIKVGNVQAEIPLTTMTDIIMSIGIDAHQFLDNFRLSDAFVPGCVKVLCGGKEELRTQMVTVPNAYALPTEKGKSLLKEKAGKLLVPSAMRVNTAHITSSLCEQPTLSETFYALRLKNENENKLKSLCLWLNTSWGILSVLADREEVAGGWIQIKMAQWRLLRVLNIDQLPEDKLRSLAQIYDQFKNVDLGRIPEQYGAKSEISEDRLALDLSFLKAMGISASESDLKALYQEIASALGQWLGK